MAPQFFEHIVILCFERWYPKESSVIRIKHFGLAKFWAGYATGFIDRLLRAARKVLGSHM